MAGLLLAAAVLSCVKFAYCSQLPRTIIPDQDWGYVDVRPGAHMFWWLYGCNGDVLSRDSRPLVMWLQGGPGGSSTGFGNFEEIGPLNVDLSPRNTTWVQAVNLLFVDNPVGSGYSYVDDNKLLTTNVSQIADDLIALFSAFLDSHQIFQTLPFYIFCESYGGKMTAAFGVALNSAIQSGKIKANFQGVALGDGWISPIDSVQSWGPYLYGASLINSDGLNKLQALANKCQSALLAGQGTNATSIWGEMEQVIEVLTDNVSMYNILDHNGLTERVVNEDVLNGLFRRHVSVLQPDSLSELMNGEMKKKLNIPDNVTWRGSSGAVFIAQNEDFMKDVISDVDSLLSSGVKVVVYNGQFDTIVSTLGTLNWIQKLQWPGLKSFFSAKRIPVYPPSGMAIKDTGAFLQSYQNFYFYWILKAGHMVPIDAGDMALEMLKMVTDTQNV